MQGRQKQDKETINQEDVYGITDILIDIETATSTKSAFKNTTKTIDEKASTTQKLELPPKKQSLQLSTTTMVLKERNSSTCFPRQVLKHFAT